MFSQFEQLSLQNEGEWQIKQTVHYWMKPPHFLVFENQSFKQILEMMTARNEDLIMINKEHEVLGIVTSEGMYRALLSGFTLTQTFNEKWFQDSLMVNAEDSMLDISYEGRVIPVINDEDKIVGSLSAHEILRFKNDYIESIKHNVELIDIILDIAYEGVAVVDRRGHILKMNKAYANFLGLKSEEVIGKYVADVIENTQLHKTVKTGIPERGGVQIIQGQKMIVHRIPIWQNDEIIGAIGMLIFEGVTELYRILENATQLSTNNPSSIDREQSKERNNRFSSPKKTFEHILGTSDALHLTKSLSRKAAKTKTTVLITGESGTGKEVFAQAIHNLSPRNEEAFIAINCAAIPEQLLEAELFGYVEGAFTGAKKGGSAGKFEMANKGTIFLDEIGDMPLSMQTKILRVLEEKEIVKVGGTKSIPLDVRIIAATNQKLIKRVEEGYFREDLYYRLNVINIEIPPLRKRKEDIPTLIAHYLDHFSKEYHVKPKNMDNAVMEALRTYDWPGNIRQLINTAEQLITLVEGDVIKYKHLPSVIREKQQHIPADVRQPLKTGRMEQEIVTIQEALERVQGNKTKAAKQLGIHRTTLYKKLNQYNLDK